MKKSFQSESLFTLMLALPAILLLCILVATLASAQQFSTRTNTVVTVPDVEWRSPNAQVIAAQLMAITNADGSSVVPAGMFTNHSSVIFIRVNVGTNGLLKSIRARIQ